MRGRWKPCDRGRQGEKVTSFVRGFPSSLSKKECWKPPPPLHNPPERGYTPEKGILSDLFRRSFPQVGRNPRAEST